MRDNDTHLRLSEITFQVAEVHRIIRVVFEALPDVLLRSDDVSEPALGAIQKFVRFVLVERLRGAVVARPRDFECGGRVEVTGNPFAATGVNLCQFNQGFTTIRVNLKCKMTVMNLKNIKFFRCHRRVRLNQK